MLFDESFWVSLSIILFVVLVFKRIKTPLIHSLKRRADDISIKITESERLRKEAVATLNECDLLYKNAQKETELFAKHLDEEIEILRNKAESDLQEKLKIRADILKSKIKNLEEKSLSDLRLKAIRLAVTVSVALLKESGSKKANIAFIENSLHIMNLKNI